MGHPIDCAGWFGEQQIPPLRNGNAKKQTQIPFGNDKQEKQAQASKKSRCRRARKADADEQEKQTQTSKKSRRRSASGMTTKKTPTAHPGWMRRGCLRSGLD